MDKAKDLDLNTAIYIGIDAHPSTHTALAINRFEEEKSHLRFENTTEGIKAFLFWMETTAPDAASTILGIEGGSTARHALLSHLLIKYHNVYEVNPIYTRQRRNAGTRGDKSDIIDAKLIAEVLTKKLSVLPKITQNELSSRMLCLKKVLGFYEEQTAHGAQLKKPTASTEAGERIEYGYS
jgi:transposase